ncbi:hypothetical protein P170DRAFT_462300 [Aspergillus steynii IBT 23096]|uniref:Transcription factor domain-containing protein n=1 Tax=Aspergillus steynii IBT 23096 TaxID=1392250 RepID=A0A2I2GHK0_9EURO|nr:uncharacterized protein P170DRAFT_462300 [Aspergillus steynii IBT 23096]PLB52317.1 hypothetical protein P170DRAFT_462300 [Aspergillus steynii IBT 23096]
MSTMAHAEHNELNGSLKRRRSNPGSISQPHADQSSGVASARSVDSDIQRCIDRINRLNALVSDNNEDGEEAELDERNIEDGNFDFPLLLASGWANRSVQPTILQKVSEMMREMDPSRALFESDIQETLPKAKSSTRLPPYEETRNLIDGYLRHFNAIFPIFQDNELRRLISRLYTQQEVLDSGSRASGYAVIAVAYKLQLWATANNNKVAAAAWTYFNAAMRLLPEISVIGNNAESNFRNIQGLTIMSIFLQGAMQFNDAPKLLGNAIRQASVFGSTQNNLPKGVCPVEVQKTRRVLYVLDKEFSLHSGLPPMTRMSYQGADCLQCGDKDAGSVLPHLSSLAAIEEEIYEELYSATAQNKPGVELLDASFDLEGKLRAWENGLPYNIRNDDGFSRSTESILLSLMLENCLITIHRLPAIHCPSTGLYSRHAGTNSEIASRIELAKKKRTEAALSGIRTVQKLRTAGLWPFWLLPSPIIVSLILLLTTIIYDPETSSSSQIIDGIDAGVRFIQCLNDRSCGEFSQMVRIATGTASIARKLQQKSKDDITARKVAQVALENAMMELRRGMRPRNRNPRFKTPSSPFIGAESPYHSIPAPEDLLYDPLKDGFSETSTATVPLNPWESLSWIGESGPSISASEWVTGDGVDLAPSTPIIWDSFM